MPSCTLVLKHVLRRMKGGWEEEGKEEERRDEVRE
jgi:hypothetical protein